MLLREIAAYLTDHGVGTYTDSAGGDIFICTMPSEPDELIAIYPTGGPRSDSANAYENPSVQVLVRGGTDTMAAFERATLIYNLLHGFCNQCFVPGGVYVVSCLGEQSQPEWIGRDELNRGEFSMNFVLHVQNKHRRN